MNPHSGFKADLHCHTYFSDGTSAPEQLLQEAAALGISTISITDHDTISAYETAIPLARNLGIELMTGVELSTRHKNCNIHVLAYGFSVDDPHILSFCKKHRERRWQRALSFLKALFENGMPLTEEDLLEQIGVNKQQGIQNVCRPHIAKAMVKKGYVPSIESAFKNYLSEGKSCYVSSEYPGVEETLDIIHKSKAVAILAHPELINRNRIRREVLKFNFDGVEAFYGRMPRFVAEKWVAFANEKNWLISGGSDYHGAIKPDFPLGSSWIEESLLRKIQNKIAQLKNG